MRYKMDNVQHLLNKRLRVTSSSFIHFSTLYFSLIRPELLTFGQSNDRLKTRDQTQPIMNKKVTKLRRSKRARKRSPLFAFAANAVKAAEIRTRGISTQ